MIDRAIDVDASDEGQGEVEVEEWKKSSITVWPRDFILIIDSQLEFVREKVNCALTAGKYCTSPSTGCLPYYILYTRRSAFEVKKHQFGP